MKPRSPLHAVFDLLFTKPRWNAILVVVSLVVLPAIAWSESSEELNLMSVKWTGSVKTSTAQLFEGGSEYSLQWNAGQQPTSTAQVILPEDLGNWSGRTFQFAMFAEEANETVVTIIATPDSAIPDAYYFYSLPVDWTGWKEFAIALTEFKSVRSPKSWEHIETLTFLSHYGHTPVEGTILYMNNIRLSP